MGDPAVMAEQASALMKRQEQIKRWKDSDTNKAPGEILNKPRKVKFQDGCVFLAACSSGDRDEVLRLLKNGADINTSNVDGLTALHQACIDDNLEMVEFLVENGADVDVCDNEGWTPLHATASCGFTDIARYLMEQGGNVAAVNNDGDLPFDICEDEEMEKVLQEEMDRQEINADAARAEEENQMLVDANKWLNNKTIREKRHPKTGATALHVAAAKGYLKVISVLLTAGADINAKDYDGWTPLHAAAHWGQEEACKVLVENMCDMEAKNNAGQTAFDVADTEIIKLLDELKKKQASQKDKLDSQNEVISTKGGLHGKRRIYWNKNFEDPEELVRSSVTRMSGDQKQSVISKTVEQERITLKAALQNHPHEEEEKEEKTGKSSSSSASEEEEDEEGESSGSETEKQNEINKNSSNQQPRDRDKPPITTVEIEENKDTLKIDEKGESVKICTKDHQNEDDRTENGMDEVPKIEKIGDSLNKLTEKEKQKEDEEKEKSEKEQEISEGNEKKKGEVEGVRVAPRGGLSRSLSAPATSPSDSQVPIISLQKPQENEKEVTRRDTPSWRAGLRKTGSSSMVIDTINEVDTKNLPRSASSPRLADTNSVDNERPSNRKAFLSTSSNSENIDTKVPDRSSSSAASTSSTTSSTTSYSRSSYTPYRYNSSTSSYQSAYIPYYRRQEENERKRQEENERKQKEENEQKQKEGKEKEDSNRSSLPDRTTQPSTTAASSLTPSLTVTSTTTSANTTTTSSITSVSSISSISSYYPSYQFRRPYEPPKRDEEAETQRKARAKRARETRRSTQGVTLEDIQKAEEVLSSTKTDTEKKDSSASVTDRKDTTSISSATSDRLRDTSSSVLSKDSDSSVSSRTSVTFDSAKKDASAVEDSVLLRRRDYDSERRDDERSSNRRSRDYLSTDSTSAYIPRRERKALSSSLEPSSLSSGISLTRSQSLRNRLKASGEEPLASDTTEDKKDRVHESVASVTRSQSLRTRSRKEDADSLDSVPSREERKSIHVLDSIASREERKEKEISSSISSSREERREKDKDKEDKSGESRRESTIQRRDRRFRRERRSTGIISYDGNNDDDETEEEKREDEKREEEKEKKDSDDKSIGQRYTSRYGSTSDVPDRYSRPSSYIEQSRSTPSLDSLDYKKLYEDEKSNSERLKRELEYTKKELVEAKAELDRLVRRNEAARVTDTNEKREKRALERKLSEYEEELKKLDALKEENKKLKDENGALIRVISKLSK